MAVHWRAFRVGFTGVVCVLFLFCLFVASFFHKFKLTTHLADFKSPLSPLSACCVQVPSRFLSPGIQLPVGDRFRALDLHMSHGAERELHS